MTDYSTTPETAGPRHDGSRSLARESKLGNLAQGALVALALYGADALGALDVTPLPDAVEPLALAAVGVAAGLLTSWAARNRKPLQVYRKH